MAGHCTLGLPLAQTAIAVATGVLQIENMAVPFDITRLTPQQRVELAEELWDSLAEEDIELTPEQVAELELRRERLERDGPAGRPWRDVLGELEQRGG